MIALSGWSSSRRYATSAGEIKAAQSHMKDPCDVWTSVAIVSVVVSGPHVSD
jgi:hypothetical protein